MATENKKMQQRRDTAANWTSGNPTLTAGEIGFETDTGKFKLGNGSTAWNSLAYAGGAMAIGGAISGGTAKRLLFTGDSVQLADDPNLYFDTTNHRIVAKKYDLYNFSIEVSGMPSSGTGGAIGFSNDNYAGVPLGVANYIGNDNGGTFNITAPGWYSSYYPQNSQLQVHFPDSDSAVPVLKVTTGGAAKVPLRIKLAASPTANALEVDSASGSGGDLFKVEASGSVNIPSGQSYKVNGVAIGGGGMSIGGAVTGGGANRVLFEDASQNLATDADFTFDGTHLLVGSDPQGQVRIGAYSTSDYGGIWFGQSTPSNTNYALWGTSLGGSLTTNLNAPAGGILSFRIDHSEAGSLNWLGGEYSWAFGRNSVPESSATTVTITAGENATHIPLVLKLSGDQSANAFEVNSVSGSGGDLFKIKATGAAVVPDEAYSSAWDGSLEVPTKNAVYDQVQIVDMMAIAYAVALG